MFGNGGNVGLNGHHFPIDHGIILSSGNITNAIGSNSFSTAGTAFYPGEGDPDLDNLVNSSTTDAAVLEFNLTPTNAFTLMFQYVFASEEYPEYIGPFNDPMAIFVSTNRVGTNWGNNITNDIALVPGLTNRVAVSVNTINGGYVDVADPTNPQYYVDNADPNYQAATNTAAIPIYNLQYDGFTTLLTAQTNLSAHITYHVKIGIADYGGKTDDHTYDSAIFIKTQTFPCQ